MTHRTGMFLKYAIGVLICATLALVPRLGVADDDVTQAPEKSLKTIKMTYAECAAWTRRIAEQYMPGQSFDILATDSDRVVVSKSYWRTPKFDEGGCFPQKDLIAAQEDNKTPEQYAVECIAPEWLHSLASLIRALESEGFRLGATCLFRGRYRQFIAEGNKAAACWSLHGGECRTGGCGHGRAADVVNVPQDPTMPETERWKLTEKMWARIDVLGDELGIRRLRGIESMHIQADGSLATIIEQNSREAKERMAALHPDWFEGRGGHKKTRIASKKSERSKVAKKGDRDRTFEKKHGKKRLAGKNGTTTRITKLEGGKKRKGKKYARR